MFDKLFYGIDKTINNAGSDYALLFVFLIAALLPVIAIVALKIRRVMQAIVLGVVLAALTFIPFTISKTLLDNLYLHTGLVTNWYIDHTPYVLRFPTLWVIGVCSISGFWLILMLIKDVLTNKPVTTKAIISKNYQDALDLNLKVRDEMKKNYSKTN